MNRIVLTFLVLTILSFGCRKDETAPVNIPSEPIICDTAFLEIRENDTVQPSPYLAANPGSWWNYDDGSLDLCFEWVEVPVYRHSKDANGCLTITTTYTFLPRTVNYSIAPH